MSFQAWFEKAKEAVEKNSRAKSPECPPNWFTLGFTEGKKNYRVYISQLDGSQKSAYCFVDKEGNIYKPAGWKGPAKGVRGHVDTHDPSNLDSSTHWLYRR